MLFKNLMFKLILRFYPKFFLTSSGFSFLYNQKYGKVSFVDDKYIYKNVDTGYLYIYREFNLSGEKILFSNFNDDVSDLQVHLQKDLHSFDWLQHIKAVDNELSSIRIEELISTWIDNYDTSRNIIAFNPKVLSSRIFNWLTSSTIVSFSNKEFKDKFFHSLSFQIRLLMKIYKIDKNIDIISLSKTLFVISRAIHSRTLLRISLDIMLKYLNNNILADGGDISKCPSITFNKLTDIVFVYKNLHKGEEFYKDKIRCYIDKMVVFIKSLRYKDGALGIFYSGYEEKVSKIDFILSLCNINASPFHNLRYSGYVSLSSENGINVFLKTPGYIVKTDLNEIDNSILSNEIFIGKSRIFINNSSYNPYFKQDCSNIRKSYSSLLLYNKSGVIDMPSKLNGIDCKVEHRIDHKWNSLISSYKGLKKSYGLVWHKSLYLEKKEGGSLLGEELLTLNSNVNIIKAVLRFILHPSIRIKEVSVDKKSIFFDIDNEEWLFRASNQIDLKKTVYKGIQGEMLYTKVLDILIEDSVNSLEWLLTKVSSKVISTIINKEESVC